MLRKKEKPAAEIFSVSYVAAGADADRPVTFVFNGGPGASSAFLHLGAVGPQRVAFPPTGRCRRCRPGSCENEESWLGVHRPRVRRPGRHGLQPRHRGRSRRTARPPSDKKKARRRATRRSTSATSATSSRCASSWAAGSPSNGRWGSPIFIAGESYGGYRVGRLVRMLQETAGIGLNGAILISPALEISTLALGRLRRARLGRPAADDGCGRSAPRPLARVRRRHRARGRPARSRDVRDRRLRGVPHARRLDACRRARSRAHDGSPISSGSPRTSSRAPRAASRSACSRASCSATSARCSASTTRRSRRPIRSPTGMSFGGPDPTLSGISPGVHDGDQPAAALGDRRRDGPRVHGARATR